MGQTRDLLRSKRARGGEKVGLPVRTAVPPYLRTYKKNRGRPKRAGKGARTEYSIDDDDRRRGSLSNP